MCLARPSPAAASPSRKPPCRASRLRDVQGEPSEGSFAQESVDTEYVPEFAQSWPPDAPVNTVPPLLRMIATLTVAPVILRHDASTTKLETDRGDGAAQSGRLYRESVWELLVDVTYVASLSLVVSSTHFSSLPSELHPEVPDVVHAFTSPRALGLNTWVPEVTVSMSRMTSQMPAIVSGRPSGLNQQAVPPCVDNVTLAAEAPCAKLASLLTSQTTSFPSVFVKNHRSLPDRSNVLTLPGLGDRSTAEEDMAPPIRNTASTGPSGIFVQSMTSKYAAVAFERPSAEASNPASIRA